MSWSWSKKYHRGTISAEAVVAEPVASITGTRMLAARDLAASTVPDADTSSDLPQARGSLAQRARPPRHRRHRPARPGGRVGFFHDATRAATLLASSSPCPAATIILWSATSPGYSPATSSRSPDGGPPRRTVEWLNLIALPDEETCLCIFPAHARGRRGSQPSAAPTTNASSTR
jgi:hypothetical protein